MSEIVQPAQALVVAVTAFLLSVFVGAWLWLLLRRLPILALGLYSFEQKTRVITRNYPVAGRIRWLFYRLCSYPRAHIVADRFNGGGHTKSWPSINKFAKVLRHHAEILRGHYRLEEVSSRASPA